MTVTISKTFDFDAAHFLPKVAMDHKCRRMHGHTYKAELIFRGEPDERGMVVDYAEITEAWQSVHDRIDHRILNEVSGLENPTTEILAPWILDWLLESKIGSWLRAVRVYESSTTWCEASVED